jgi:serine/threonine protein phosphatase 1
MLTPVFQCPPRGARLRRAAILLCGFQLYRLRHAFVQFAKYRPDVAEYVSPHQPTPCPLHIGQSKTSMLTIVIGDIHGMAAKLQNLLSQIDVWLQANAEGEPHQFIFLGDYIDRGPDTREVLQIVQRLQAAGAICLRGNHEELMLRATESERDLTNFLFNGGDSTIASLHTPAAFRRAQEWMRTLPTSYEDPLRYYVHAGVRPGIPLDEQTDETKLWIRESFLHHTKPFPKYIVCGHTPTIYSDPRQVTPDIRDNYCNVDTGAGMMGPLSAAIFNDRHAKPIHAISVGAEG